MAVAMVALVGCQPSLPRLTGQQFNDFYNRYQPMPSTVFPASLPAITGDPAADDHIRVLAVARGYRQRSVHSGPLATALGVPVDPQVVEPLNDLEAEAARRGYTLTAAYGYRSADLQRTIFMRGLVGYTAADIVAGRADGAIDAELAGVAAPGYSKHEGGFTLDLRGGGDAGAFGTSPVGRWLAADDYAAAKRFGFIPSYPPDTAPQGPHPEPWEYIYVGTTAIHCSLHLAQENDRPAFDACMAA